MVKVMKVANTMYVNYEVPPELAEEALHALEVARTSGGKLKRGTNEVTKIIERGQAKLVVIAEDVTPPEIVAHLPLLCDEKSVPYVFVSTRNELGAASGIDVPSATVVVVNAGESKKNIENIIAKIKELRK